MHVAQGSCGENIPSDLTTMSGVVETLSFGDFTPLVCGLGILTWIVLIILLYFISVAFNSTGMVQMCLDNFNTIGTDVAPCHDAVGIMKK